MTSYKLIARSAPVPLAEDAYNDWYSGTHLQDVLAVPGVVRATRFRLCEPELNWKPSFRYFAIYDIEADDPKPVVDDILSRAGTDAMVLSPSMADNFEIACFEVIADKH